MCKLKSVKELWEKLIPELGAVLGNRLAQFLVDYILKYRENTVINGYNHFYGISTSYKKCDMFGYIDRSIFSYLIEFYTESKERLGISKNEAT